VSVVHAWTLVLCHVPVWQAMGLSASPLQLTALQKQRVALTIPLQRYIRNAT